MADAAETTLPPKALTLWLTDRSRVEQGREHCQRARYLGYHAGPTGYGWQRRASSIPQATGTLVHEPLAAVLSWAQAHQGALPPDEVIYGAILAAKQRYQRLVDERGLSVIVEPGDLAFRVAEQTTLLEGLVWAWCRVILPGLLETWDIIAVEQEEVTVLGCTCGLGDGILEAADHDSRGCRGIGWMTRGDAILRRKAAPHTYAYWEFKTTSTDSKGWEEQWPYRIQVMAGVLGAEARLGQRVDEIYISGLIKGRHEAEYNYETKSKSGLKFQNSPLVYGWRRPANPPLLPEDWAHSYNYVDDLGKNRRLGKDYARTPVWMLPEAWWAQGGALSPSDFWCRWVHSTGVLGEQVRTIGPIYRQDRMLARFTGSLVAEELRWNKVLWAVYEAGGEWAAPETQAMLDREIPQTFGGACLSYFGEKCPYESLCYYHEGWQQPEHLGFVPRRPHHTPELDQAVSRGLIVAEASEIEEAD